MSEKENSRGQLSEESLIEEIIELDRSKLLEYKCELNDGSLFNTTPSTRVFKCEQCNMDFLCAQCMIKCHKPFHQDKITFTEPVSPFAHLCSCGIRNHVVQKDDTKSLSKTGRVKAKCYLSLKEFSNASFVAKKDTSTNTMYCVFCIEFCYKSLLKPSNLVPVSPDENVRCCCTIDKNHVQSALDKTLEPIVSGLPPLALSHTFLTNSDLWRLSYGLLYFIHEKIFDYFNRKTITEDGMTLRSFDLVEQFKNIEVKGKMQFELFISSLKQVRKFPNHYWLNQEVIKYFRFDHVIKILSIPKSETKNETLILIQMFYCTCYRLIFCPKTSAIELFSPNVSSLHRILLLKTPTNINENNATPDQIRKILTALKPIIYSSKDSSKKQCCNEYLKLLEYLIDSNINDFNQVIADFSNFITNDIITEMQKLQIILREEEKRLSAEAGKKKSAVPVKEIKQSKPFKIQRLVEKMVIYQNDYYFYYEMFKKQINYGNEIGGNVNEDNNFSFKNNEFNQLLIDLLVNTDPNIQGKDFNYTHLVDMLFNQNDCFIESLEQVASHKMPFDPTINSLIINKDEEFLKIDPLKEQFNQIRAKIQQIEDRIYDSFIPFRNLNNNEVISILNQIFEIMVNISKDKSYFFRFQMVFVSTQLLGRLINIFEFANILDKQADPKKNDHFKQYQELLYKILFIICNDNPMTTVLFFNHSRHKKNKFAFLSLDNNEALGFYLHLLKILRRHKYNINTDIFCEMFRSYSSKLATNLKTFSIDEFNSLLQIAKVILTVASKKCYFTVCQSVLIQLHLIYQQFQYNGISIGNMLKEPLNSYKSEHIKILEPFFGLINKFNNDTFDLFKETIDIEDITQLINESKSINNCSSVGLTMLLSELILFYSQYHFGSLYSRDVDKLIHYSQLQIYIKKIQPFFDYLEHFNQLLHNDMTDRQILNCFIKGVGIPSTLLQWKISSFAIPDGIAKYSIYNITCWFFIHFKKTLESLERKFIQANKSEEEINLLLETFLSEIITREELYMRVKTLHHEITSEKFSCLEESNCLIKFFEIIQYFKFFINSQELMNEKQFQDQSNKTRIQRVKDLSFFGTLKQTIFKYNEQKQEYKENVLIELFDETKSDNHKAATLGSILINSITTVKPNYNDISEMKLIDYFDVFDMSKVPYLITITKLFKQNPSLWQDIILDNPASSNLIFQLMSIAIRVFAQFVFADYTRIIPNSSIYYTLLIESIEFLRLLCEDHNPFFQTILIQNSQSFMPITYPILDLMFDISTEITKHVRHFSMQNTAASQFFKKENYFENLSEKLREYETEIIQGTRYENLVCIANNKSFNAFLDSYYEFMDYCTEKNEYAVLTSKFLEFINCFFEEFLVYKHMPLEEHIIPLISRLNPKKMANFAEKSFKKMLDERIQKNENASLVSQQMQMGRKDQRAALMVKCVEEILDNIYLEYDTLKQNNYFMNAFNIFLHLTQIRDFKNDKYGPYQIILETLENSENEVTKNLLYKVCSLLLLNNEVMYTLNFAQNQKKAKKYVDLFRSLDVFEKNYVLFSEFEDKMLQVGGVENIKQTNRLKIYYLAQKDSVLLKETDFNSFDKSADYEDYFTKLSGILKYYYDYSTIIDTRIKFLENNQPFKIKLNELNYDLLEKINCVLCIIPSLLLIFKSPGDMYSHLLFYWIIFQLIFLFTIICNFVVFSCLKKTILTSNDKIRFEDLSTIMLDSKIVPFEWTFIWGLLGLRFDFLLSLQLFAIFNISETMKSALNAIKTRYDQFLSTGFLLIILLLFYSAVTLYFFSDKGDGTSYCTNYLDCFLYLLNNGLRGGGLSFENKIKEQPGYWTEFIYSWIFYFLIILIILNIVNGIIVDTFQELREQNNEIALSRENVCFICQLTRGQFDNKGLNFDQHRETEHNVLNYFKYLFKIHRTDQHELNSVDFNVYKTVKQERVDFFPIDRANGFDEPKSKKLLMNDDEKEANNDQPFEGDDDNDEQENDNDNDNDNEANAGGNLKKLLGQAQAPEIIDINKVEPQEKDKKKKQKKDKNEKGEGKSEKKEDDKVKDSSQVQKSERKQKDKLKNKQSGLKDAPQEKQKKLEEVEDKPKSEQKPAQIKKERKKKKDKKPVQDQEKEKEPAQEQDKNKDSNQD